MKNSDQYCQVFVGVDVVIGFNISFIITFFVFCKNVNLETKNI